MITVESNFLSTLYGLVAEMFNDLGPIETGIFSILLFGFLVRQILHWIKVSRYV